MPYVMSGSLCVCAVCMPCVRGVWGTDCVCIVGMHMLLCVCACVCVCMLKTNFLWDDKVHLICSYVMGTEPPPYCLKG